MAKSKGEDKADAAEVAALKLDVEQLDDKVNNIHTEVEVIHTKVTGLKSQLMHLQELMTRMGEQMTRMGVEAESSEVRQQQQHSFQWLPEKHQPYTIPKQIQASRKHTQEGRRSQK